MGIPGENNAKTLLIGCSGSVACIKIPEILALLQRRFPEVKIVVIPTAHAGHFLPKDKFVHFSQHNQIAIVDPLHCGWEDFGTLTETAIAFLIAPLGANLMAKLANPCLLQSSNLERALQHFLRYRGGRELPLILAPAMNSMMWNSVVTEKNMETIRLLYGSDGGVTFIPTVNKPSVCGETGFGPMASPIDIVEYLENALAGRSRPVIVQKDNIVAATGPILRTILPSRSRQPETDEALDCPRSLQLSRRCSRDAPGYRHCLQMLLQEHKDSFDDIHILIGAADISDGSSVAVQPRDTLADFKMNIKTRFIDKFMADLQKLKKEHCLLDHITESMNLQESRIVLKYIATDNLRKQSPQNFEPGQNLMNMDFFSDTDEWRIWEKREDPVLHILLRQWADGMLLLNPTELLLQKIAAGVCDDLLTCVIRAWDYSQDIIFAMFDEDGRSVLEKISPQQSEELRQRGIQLISINSSSSFTN